MKNIIESFYRIEVEEIEKNNLQLSFISNDDKYIFQEYSGRPSMDVLIETQKYNFFHKIIRTYDGSIFLNYNNKRYILFKINIRNNRKITLKDIVNLSKIKINKKYINNNWWKLWLQKIDNFENYIMNKGESFEFRDYYDYFIGMGENAILYSKYVDFNEVSYGFTLNRVNINYTLQDLYNPLNIIISFSTRGIGDYLRSLFFSKKELNFNDLSKIAIGYYDRILLFSRMLFPIQFFDLFKNGKEENREKMQNVISQSFLYEKYILEIINVLKKRHEYMPSINWLGISQF